MVAGPLTEWEQAFARIAAMGFGHVCLAPPFEPGASGDIFVHSTFDRLHPALGFAGPADSGIAMIADLARRQGLLLMLDIAPGQIAAGSPLRTRKPDWFRDHAGRAADPRQAPQRLDIAVPLFDRAEQAEAVADWWSERLSAWTEAGVAGFRCLTLGTVPREFWLRLRRELPDSLWLAWTPDLTDEQVRRLDEATFDFTCGLLTGVDRVGAEFIERQADLGRIGTALVSPEASFLDRLATHLPPNADRATSYRVALRAAAATGSGLFIPMGFEFATRRRFDAVMATPADMQAAREEARIDLTSDITEAVALSRALPPARTLRSLGTQGQSVVALLRSESADIRDATEATMVLINGNVARSAPLDLSVSPLPATAGAPFVARNPGTPILGPGEVRVIPCDRVPNILGDSQILLRRGWAEASRIAVESVAPVVPGGDFPAKTVIGRDVVVSADIFGDGHDVLAAEVLWRAADAADWQRTPMRKVSNDRWEAAIRPIAIGLYHFAVEGWWDQWATFSHDLSAKVKAGQQVDLEIQEGRALVDAAAARSGGALAALTDADVDMLLSADLAAAMQQADAHPFAARSATYTIRVDRPAAEFASWYELFPRSATHDKSVHGTFRSVMQRLPDIRAMGFDVLYFPPIHPIGTINRKGRNNSLKAGPDDVGSPYAIGGAAGGHDAVHPELGTLDDFRALLQAAHDHGLEIAVDFAIQCAPDHPWITQHRDWFRWRPDGSMRYAENPPKKYEDIVNPDFYGEASFPAVWEALRDVIQFWVDQGVRIFRVDNPHTKPLPFWQWMIADIQGRHPDVLFLAEAFTRPKLMYRLGKIGFSQSYTYFTWRNTKAELTEYLEELTKPPVSDFYRPNFFVNTPDINPVFLQTSGRPGFLIRAALAATLSGLWGIYSGFEICESAPLPGREEYLDSEKYEIRPRDYAAPGNIVQEITTLNRIRCRYPALQSHLGLRFLPATNDQIIYYSKRDPNGPGMILVAVNLDPHSAQEATIEVPLWLFGLPDQARVTVLDLMHDTRFTWEGKYQRIRLDPAVLPFAIWRIAGAA